MHVRSSMSYVGALINTRPMEKAEIGRGGRNFINMAAAEFVAESKSGFRNYPDGELPSPGGWAAHPVRQMEKWCLKFLKLCVWSFAHVHQASHNTHAKPNYRLVTEKITSIRVETLPEDTIIHRHRHIRSVSL